MERKEKFEKKVLNSEVNNNVLNHTQRLRLVNFVQADDAARFAGREEMDEGIGRIMKDNGFK